MRRSDFGTLLFLGVLCCFLSTAPAQADGALKWMIEVDEESVERRQATPDEVSTHTAALKKAGRARETKDVLAAMEAITEFHHEDFVKPLLKLTLHKSEDVAATATKMLIDRVDEKGWKSLWKNAFSQKVNKKRYAVRSIVVFGMGRKGIELDKKQYGEVEKDWRFMVGNPQEHFAGPLVNYTHYFQLAKDKRHCRKLAEELDEPGATNVNAPSNPPAEWWERRWKMWKPAHSYVVRALKVLTGQEFTTCEQAKEWFEANEKEFGFEW
jgi:hypothetical protein